MYKIGEKIITFLPPEDIEVGALEQIKNTSELPFLFHHVAVMPDTHYGKGATIGTVLASRGAVVPAAVGVDIGCGMIAVKTTLEKEELSKEVLEKIKLGIERRIPMSAGKFNSKITETAQSRIFELERLATDTIGNEHYDKISPNWRNQLGTLGGGNHFIEICYDENEDIWVTLHSGSRGVGNKIGNMYIQKARDLMEKLYIKLKDPDLAYLPENTQELYDYLRDLKWAQKFAMFNREEMLDRVMMELSTAIFGVHKRGGELELERINCHHNFTQREHHLGHDVWITRKGAIEAGLGKLGMIPGSMGTQSYIVSGLGNPMSFNSAPHGAGRRFSRGEARKRFTMEDFDKAMVGIVHRRSDVLLDELPDAYKDIDTVMENAEELVKVEHTLKQVLNCKGD